MPHADTLNLPGGGVASVAPPRETSGIALELPGERPEPGFLSKVGSAVASSGFAEGLSNVVSSAGEVASAILTRPASLAEREEQVTKRVALQNLVLGFDAATKIANSFANISDPEEQQQFLNDALADAGPGLSDIARGFAQRRLTFIRNLPDFFEKSPTLRKLFGGNVLEFEKALGTKQGREEVMSIAEKDTDRFLLPALKEGGQIQAVMEDWRQRDPAAHARAVKDGVSPTDVAAANIGAKSSTDSTKNTKLTNAQMGTIFRNPGELSDQGITDPGVEAKAAEANLKTFIKRDTGETRVVPPFGAEAKQAAREGFTPLTQIIGKAEDVFGAPGKAEVKEFFGTLEAVQTIVSLSGQIKELILANPTAVGTLSGEIASFANNVAVQADQLAQLFGGKNFIVQPDGTEIEVNSSQLMANLSESASESVDGFVGRFGATAEERARLKAAIIRLGFAQARAFNKSGRLTDKDFSLAVESIGRSSDPKIFAKVLDDVQESSIRSIEQSFRNLKVRVPKQDLSRFDTLIQDMRSRFNVGVSRGTVEPANILSVRTISRMSLPELARLRLSLNSLPLAQQQAAIDRLKELLGP